MSNLPDPSGPTGPDRRQVELVAARAVGVMVVEGLLRARVAPLLFLAFGGGALAFVAGIVIGDAAGVLLGVIGVVLLLAGLVLLLVRTLAIGAVRRVVGGPYHAVTRPILQRHRSELRAHRDGLPLGGIGVFDVIRFARRPHKLEATIRETARALETAAPRLLSDVRTALADADADADAQRNSR